MGRVAQEVQPLERELRGIEHLVQVRRAHRRIYRTGVRRIQRLGTEELELDRVHPGLGGDGNELMREPEVVVVV